MGAKFSYYLHYYFFLVKILIVVHLQFFPCIAVVCIKFERVFKTSNARTQLAKQKKMQPKKERNAIELEDKYYVL